MFLLGVWAHSEPLSCIAICVWHKAQSCCPQIHFAPRPPPPHFKHPIMAHGMLAPNGVFKSILNHVTVTVTVTVTNVCLAFPTNT
jgi:hypothetical protein